MPPIHRISSALKCAAFGLIIAATAGAGSMAGLAQADRTTPFFTCGEDEQIAAAIPLTRANVLLAMDNRGFGPCGPHTPEHREAREAALIDAASRASDAALRRLAAMAFGRMGIRSAVVAAEGTTGLPALARLLSDRDATVRREAADAIGNALSGQPTDPSAGPVPPAAVLAGRALLEARLRAESNDAVVVAILETLGRLRYGSDEVRGEVENLLVQRTLANAARLHGAVRGLEALIRQTPRRAIASETRSALRSAAWRGDPATQRVAMIALQTVGDDDLETLMKAAANPDWQVRRIVAGRLDWTKPEMRDAAAAMLEDPDFQVRYESLAIVAREVTRTKLCAPLAERSADIAPLVSMRAIDLIPATCTDRAEVVKRLMPIVELLKDDSANDRWHRPARALVAIARVSAPEAAPLVAVALVHQIPQVRAAAAAAAALTRDEATLEKLARDSVPNVRTAAIEALGRMMSPAVRPAAIDALKSDDFQLVRAAALALRGTPEAERANVATALLDALARLTDKGWDTSRDPRRAIVDRLRELLPASAQADRLARYRTDFDPDIRAAVAPIFSETTGPAPAITYRRPVQPMPADFGKLPNTATITMAGGGVIQMRLLVDDAPNTVARFAEYVRAGHYNGLTFHRIVPNFVVQGGSPGASEYMGAPRYWRDEVGLAPNVRGAVGLSTRGRDTADGQIFFDLVDVPRLDHDYTIFANVTTGMDVVDRMLEGAKIQSIVVR